MSGVPTLSICVPSRNRQDTFQQTIIDLLASPRADVEFVFADNSDQPEIIDGFMAAIDDPRVVYLPSSDETLPMQDNWERTIAATSGRWICFIGDDDYVDPELAGLIADIVARAPDVEAITWNKPSFKWLDYRPFGGHLAVSLSNTVKRADRPSLFRRMFLWEQSNHVPTMPFTIYHGAVARPVMERIRHRYGGRYFEHPTVDFDCGNKLLLSATAFVAINRPLSILGATEKSNSSSVGRYAKVLENYDTFLREKGSRFEAEGDMADFPFRASLGIAASVMSAQHWFKSHYDVRIDGWQTNFVQALARDCSRAIDRQEFDTQSELCRRAVAAFEDGRFLSAFQPRFHGRYAGIFTGLRDDTLYIDEAIGGCRTPAEIYRLLQSLIEPMTDLRYDPALAAAHAA